MAEKQNRTLFTLVGLGALYFFLFIFPNLTGAQDANMLAVFEVDEFAQYPHVIRMLTPADTPYQTLRNFFIYLHYVYGYPLFFFSALALLPLKLVFGAGWTEMTPLIVLVLRQVLSVFPTILSVMMLVYVQTRFKSLWKSAALFVFLLSIPAVVGNNMFWHPDSLSTLFVVGVFFFLELDSLKFGRNFVLAAVACGLAIGTKNQGQDSVWIMLWEGHQTS